MPFLTYDEGCARLGLHRLQPRRQHCDLITCLKGIHGFNCVRSNDFLLFEASKLLVIIHSNCVCKTIELMLDSISLVRVWLPFATNCQPRFLMWLLSLRLLQSFALAFVIGCVHLYNFLNFLKSIDLRVRVFVYTFTCTYFYCLVYIAFFVCVM